jgi:hypothetical protein
MVSDFYQDLFLGKWMWVNWNIQAKSQQNHSIKYGNISAKFGSVSPLNIVDCFTSVKKNIFEKIIRIMFIYSNYWFS